MEDDCAGRPGTRRGLAQLVAGDEDAIALFDNLTHAWNASFCSVAPATGGTYLLDATQAVGLMAGNFIEIFECPADRRRSTTTLAFASRPASIVPPAALNRLVLVDLHGAS